MTAMYCQTPAPCCAATPPLATLGYFVRSPSCFASRGPTRRDVQRLARSSRSCPSPPHYPRAQTGLRCWSAARLPCCAWGWHWPLAAPQIGLRQTPPPAANEPLRCVLARCCLGCSCRQNHSRPRPVCAVAVAHGRAVVRHAARAKRSRARLVRATHWPGLCRAWAAAAAPAPLRRQARANAWRLAATPRCLPTIANNGVPARWACTTHWPVFVRMR